MRERNFRDHRGHKNPSGSILAGLLVLVIGVVLLLKQLHLFFFPHWLFTWPVLFIIIGLFVGVKKQFNGFGWLALVLLGAFFLFKDLVVFNWHLGQFAVPVVIIMAGLFLMFRSSISSSRRDYFSDFNTTDETKYEDTYGDNYEKKTKWGNDFVDNTNVFGSSKKKIFSKSFTGGDITNFFGGTELDLTQADIEHIAVLDMVQVFGGVKLIIPANWSVRSDVVSIFGGVNDKRSTPSSLDNSNKMLVLTGACIFGGIEIKSY